MNINKHSIVYRETVTFRILHYSKIKYLTWVSIFYWPFINCGECYVETRLGIHFRSFFFVILNVEKYLKYGLIKICLSFRNKQWLLIQRDVSTMAYPTPHHNSTEKRVGMR